MDLSNNNPNENNTEYTSTVYYNSYGQISDLFSSPVIPKMVIVGLNDEMINSTVEMEKLKLFKEILVKSLDNLFIVEFQEQVTITKTS